MKTVTIYVAVFLYLNKMQEDFLHYIWQHQKLVSSSLKTVQGERVQVISVGQINANSGPDFFNARLVIEEQEWAGNVEIHVKSSDWYVHQHETDENYGNVVLHVVWEDDVVIFDAYEKPLKTLELKQCVEKNFLENYKKLISNKTWINCQSTINTIDTVTLTNLKDSLLVSRLERKAEEIQKELLGSKYNWESILFEQLTKAFGLKVNTEMFNQLANSISFTVFKKEMSSVLKLEALLYGQANMLLDNISDPYYILLKKEYTFLKHKYKLKPIIGSVQFFRMRPAGFPTVRLSQLAMLYYVNKNLFSELIKSKTTQEIREIIRVSTSPYWEKHYTFKKESKARIKRVSNSFVNILIVNVILPIKYLYFKIMGEASYELILEMYKRIEPERNSVISKFNELKVVAEHAGDTQALLELKKYYCDTNRCLSCKVGNKLLYQ